MKEKIQNLIEKALKNLSFEVHSFSIDHPDDFSHGDYSTNVALVCAKELKMKPRELAEQISAKLSEHSNILKNVGISKVEVAGAGFINFYLSPEFFTESVKEILKEKENYGKSDKMSGEKIMVDYTDPNPFKEFHIGHLMSNAIGESVCRIFECNGAKISRACYQGDVGLHVAKAIWGILQDKNNFPEDNAHLSTKIAFLGKSYVLGSQKYEDDPKAVEEIKNINKQIFEKSDTEINKIYEKGKKWSLLHFDEIYKKLGTKFDHIIPESLVIKDGEEIVAEFLKKGIFEKSDGAIIFRGENYGLHTRVFINSQGLPTYETKDIGLAKKKNELEKNLTASIVVTANEQNDYFKVVFKALSFIFPDYAKISKHIGHGMLRFASGKMSSRKGNVITGESLISQVEDIVKEKVKDRNYSEIEKKDIVEKVAIGAIKYSILHQAIGGDIIFDFDKSISFEGDSGPYLQYSYVRAQSILAKAGKIELRSMNYACPVAKNSDFSATGELRMKEKTGKETEKLEKMLYRFPEVVERAGRESAPHYIATYLTELAGAFNGFYANEKIVDEKDPNSPYKISLTEAVSIVLKNGLNLLGIGVPEKM